MADARTFPGLDVVGAYAFDLLLAALDDYGPTAVDDSGATVRAFFRTADARDAAVTGLRGDLPALTITPVDVPDEHWAERSQAALTPVTVGALTIAPPWAHRPADRDTIVILPSMGFGTGHHASTRMCLALLQAVPPGGLRVCDVGTGSGVLALAAAHLGATEVVALDHDPDALEAARESAALNPAIPSPIFRKADLEQPDTVAGAPFDLVVANLTGGLLQRLCPRLVGLAPGGRLILSGITSDEGPAVEAAFAAAGCTLEERLSEGEWLGQAWSVPAPDAP